MIMATLHAAQCDGCGFTGRYKSDAVAAYALSRHSCATVRARAERAARVKARREDPGVRRDCQHKEADHQHGTRQAYVLDKCRCRPCRIANAEHEAARTKAKAYGRYDVGRVDAQPAREHLAMLAENGISLKRAAELAGVAQSTLGHIVYGRKERGEGPRKRIERRVADAILAVRPGFDSMPEARIIDGTGTARRIQALVAIGHSINSLAAAAGLRPQPKEGQP
jgi:lambda repressor-like predicted transcriptional regulator